MLSQSVTISGEAGEWGGQPGFRPTLQAWLHARGGVGA